MAQKKVKITKKDLKEDQFIDFTTQVIEYFLENKQKFVIAGMVLVVIALGVVTGYYIQGKYNEHAAELFSQGIKLLHPEQSSGTAAKKSPSKEDIEKAHSYFAQAIDKYSRSKIAPQACYYAALTALRMGDTEKAETYFKTFSEKYGEHPLAFEVAVNRAVLLMEKEDFSGATKAFEAIIDRFKDNPNIGLVILKKAVCLQKLKQIEEARTAFQTVIDTYGESPWASEARDLVRLLPQKPEMEKNEPDNTASPTTPKKTDETK